MFDGNNTKYTVIKVRLLVFKLKTDSDWIPLQTFVLAVMKTFGFSVEFLLQGDKCLPIIFIQS